MHPSWNNLSCVYLFAAINWVNSQICPLQCETLILRSSKIKKKNLEKEFVILVSSKFKIFMDFNNKNLIAMHTYKVFFYTVNQLLFMICITFKIVRIRLKLLMCKRSLIILRCFLVGMFIRLDLPVSHLTKSYYRLNFF